jgi:RNA polymerase sigma factor (sigma-70 family)
MATSKIRDAPGCAAPLSHMGKGTHMATGLHQFLDHLQQVLAPPGGGSLADGQLLERFLAARDEASFAALVRRHGPMVLGVCRRVLGNHHDAEDAFQATFLVLARKASAVRRDAVASWLYGVAYRSALEARGMNSRRRAREKPLHDLPDPPVLPAEPQDWRPLLDLELNRLDERYRRPIVLCDLEGLPRKEAARVLGLAEGTLSSRLARGRRVLATRLSRYGLVLSGGALATALTQEATAAVSLSLVASTTKAALLVAAGQTAVAATPAAVLMKEVLKTMFLAKLKTVVATAFILVALGVGGLVYRASGEPAGGKPLSEIEALRKENELLKLNLQVVLEKVRAQESELQDLKKQVHGAKLSSADEERYRSSLRLSEVQFDGPNHEMHWNVISQNKELNRDPVQVIEAALKALQNSADKDAPKHAAEALEKALKLLKQPAEQKQPKDGQPPKQ